MTPDSAHFARTLCRGARQVPRGRRARASSRSTRTCIPTLRGADGEALAMDVALLGPPDARRRARADVGDARRRRLSAAPAPGRSAARRRVRARGARGAGVAVLLVHAVNPHGFSHLRRANEDNVDLNRNFRDFAAPPPRQRRLRRGARASCVPATWPPPPENEARIGAYVAEHGERALQAAVTGGQCEFPDGLFFGGARAAWSNGRCARCCAARSRRAGALGVDRLSHGARTARATARRSTRAATIAADLARARAWWGDDVTSFYDGSSTSAPLDRRHYQRRLRGMPGRRVHRRSRSNTAPFRCIDGAAARCAPTSGCANHPEAPDALRAAIKRQMRDAFYVDADDWKAQVYAPGARARRCAARCRTATRALTRRDWRTLIERRMLSAGMLASHRRRRCRRAPALGGVGQRRRVELPAFAGGDRLGDRARPSASSAALFAPWVAPHNPFDLRTLNLLDALSPPAWDERRQGRRTCSAPTTRAATCSRRSCSARASRSLVGLAAVALAIVLGVSLGLLAGYVGGKLDAFIMRVADVQLSFPAILIALLIDGVARAVLPRDAHRQRRARRADPRDRRRRTGCSTRAPCAARRWSRRTRSTSRRRA